MRMSRKIGVTAAALLAAGFVSATAISLHHRYATRTPIALTPTASTRTAIARTATFPVAAHTPVAPVRVTPGLHPGRNGSLTVTEMRMARAAWSYFVPTTRASGLVDAVGGYPSTTMWDTASYLSALVSAYELGIIDKHEFDNRMLKVLGALHKLDLFRGELPNKVYNTITGAKVDYSNKPGEIGYSALDVGRMLVWLDIIKERYPYLANTVDNIPLGWNFCHATDGERMNGSSVGPGGKTTYFQEGRLGYEEYAAKGFGLWGFDMKNAVLSTPLSFIEIYGVNIPFDRRDPRVLKTENYVLSESYILDGIELNWDLPDDDYSGPYLHTDGWIAEFAQRVYLAQQRRFEHTGQLTARTEHQVEGDPFFVYDTVYADGYSWNTLSPTNVYEPDRAAVAVKGAVGLWALWDTPYTDKLFEAVSDLYTDKGYDEGLYEGGRGVIPLQTANNNGIILAALLYKVEGPILQRLNHDKQIWWTGIPDGGERAARCLPSKPVHVDCVQSGLCSTVSPELKLPLIDYEYCRPVPSSEWFPGDPLAHPEPAARDCQLVAAQTAAPDAETPWPKAPAPALLISSPPAGPTVPASACPTTPTHGGAISPTTAAP